jgi:WD40 repeat protein
MTSYRTLRSLLLPGALGLSSCCATPTEPSRPDVVPSASIGALVRPPPGPPSLPIASAEAPRPAPPEPPERAEEPVRWLAGPPRALLTRKKDVVLLDPARVTSTVLAPEDGDVVFAGGSPSGALLGVLTNGGHLHLYQPDGRKLRSLPCAHPDATSGSDARPVAFSADDKQVAALCKDIELFDVESGRSLAHARDRYDESAMVAFRSDPAALVVASSSDFRAYDLASLAALGASTSYGGGATVSVLSPDGRFIAATLADPSEEKLKARMFHTLPASLIGPLGPDEPYQGGLSASFSPDGAALFLRRVGLWTKVIAPSSMRARVKASTPRDAGYAPSLSADGSRAVIFSETGSSVVDVKTGAAVSKLEGRTYAPNEISPDGAFALEPSNPGAVLRSTSDGKVLLRFGEQPVEPPRPEAPPGDSPADAPGLANAHWLNDRQLLAWGSKITRLVDVQAATAAPAAEGVGPLLQMDTSPRGDLALLVGRGGVELRGMADGAIVGSLRAPIWGDGSGVALSHDGRRLAQASEQIRVWDMQTGSQIAIWKAPVFQPIHAAFTADPDVLIVVGPASFALLEVSSGLRIGEEHNLGTGATFPTTVSHDGRWVGAGSADGHASTVWSAYPFRLGPTLATAMDCQNHTSPWFTADSRRVSAWSNGEVLIFEVGTWRKVGVRRPVGPEDAWLPSDGAEKVGVLTGEPPGKARVIELSTRRKLATLEGEVRGPLAVSHDGSLVVEAAGKELIVRSMKDGKVKARVPSGE